MDVPSIIILFTILLMVSAFFAGIEVAYFSLTAHRVRSMKKRGLQNANSVERLKKRPHRLMVTILIGNNLVNIFIASLASAIAVSLFGVAGVGIATIVITIVILIVGDVVPKTLAISHASKIARHSAKIVSLLEIVFYPIVVLLEKLAVLLSKLTTNNEHNAYTIEEDVRSLMQLGYEKGTLEAYEHAFVERLFLFDDKPVSRVMVPLSDVYMFRHDQTIHDVELLAVNSGYSRFPVCKNQKANICGVVHIKDIVTANNKRQGDNSIEEIMTQPTIFNQNEIINDVLITMRKKRVHYAIVVGPKKPVGIVTLEDIIEELLGEIHDEYDAQKRKHF